jgi:hypothetical protein
MKSSIVIDPSSLDILLPLSAVEQLKPSTDFALSGNANRLYVRQDAVLKDDFLLVIYSSRKCGKPQSPSDAVSDSCPFLQIAPKSLSTLLRFKKKTVKILTVLEWSRCESE